MEFYYTFVLLALAATFTGVSCKKLVGISNMKITKMVMCDPSVDYAHKLFNEVRMEGNKQLLTGKMIFKTTFGENSRYDLSLSLKKTRDATDFAPLLNVTDDTCVFLKKFFGQFIDDMEKAAGIAEGKCPIEKGTYTLTDYHLDFGKMAYQALPEGIFHAVHVISDKNTKEVLMCIEADAENFPNSDA